MHADEREIGLGVSLPHIRLRLHMQGRAGLDQCEN